VSTRRHLVTRHRSALSAIQLIDHVRLFAAEVVAGHYPYVQFDAENRWHQRLYRDARFDIWLISWMPTQGTQLHDHGGSSGAFAVTSGQLSEAVYRRRPGRGPLTEYQRPAGAAIGFGPKYVHDVRNLSDAPAVSVHAYSPPLTTMNFYDVEGDGSLQRLTTVATDDPEPNISEDLAALRQSQRVGAVIG
jgi:predicted metal-dependent enzyme (double-stranded beta helix superfamily)